MGKNILLSKTFWLNVLGAAVVVAGVVPTTKAGMIVLAAANIGVRLVTNQPVNIFPQESPPAAGPTPKYPQTK